MACYQPLKAFRIGKSEKTGKPIYKITDYRVDHIEYHKDGYWHKCYDPFVSRLAHEYNRTFIEIPCGKCIGCRLDHAKDWSNRCLMELQEHDSSYFITLTYNDINLPMTSYVKEDTGEIFEVPTLKKTDFQDFIKALRQALPEQKLRYYMAGEYGTGSDLPRPHYHVIIFGLKLDDLIFYKSNERGDKMYNSPLIDKIWKKGFCVVGNVTEESCNYTARYVMKKVNCNNEVYKIRNMQPEFTLMSTHPGIAKSYYEKHPGIMEYEHIFLSTENGGKKIGIPRYFKRLQEKVDPDRVESKKRVNRKLLKVRNAEKLKNTSLSYLDQLKVEEENKLAKIRILKERRNL